MGKGDKKSRKGKITIGSYGKTRPKNKVKSYSASAKPVSAESEPVVEKKPASKKVAEPKKPAEKKATKKKEG
jgi:30S ribosomal protein S31